MKKKPILLLVEDQSGLDVEAGLESDLKWLLEHKGYFVVLYENGLEAKEAIQEGLSYHLSIFDLSLPEVGGDELIRLSKRTHPDVPVICISGYDTLREMAPGADRYLVKPSLMNGLYQVITELLMENKDN